MQAVILAAGRGRRMGDLTLDTPKPLLRVKGKTLLEHKLDSFPEAITEVIIVVGYLENQIREAIGDEYDGRHIVYVEQKELNGTMGALLTAKEVLGDEFLVLMGDDMYAKEDIALMITEDVALCAKYVFNEERGGELLVDEKGNLKGMHEKRHFVKKGLIVTGLYKLDKAFLDVEPVLVNGGPELGIPHTLIAYAQKKRVGVVVTDHPWVQISNKEDLEGVERG